MEGLGAVLQLTGLLMKMILISLILGILSWKHSGDCSESSKVNFLPKLETIKGERKRMPALLIILILDDL